MCRTFVTFQIMFSQKLQQSHAAGHRGVQMCRTFGVFRKLSFQKLQQSHTAGHHGVQPCRTFASFKKIAFSEVATVTDIGTSGSQMGTPTANADAWKSCDLCFVVVVLWSQFEQQSHTYRRPCVRFLKHSQLSVWMLWQAQGSGQGRRHAVDGGCLEIRD